ncbi:MAG: DUF2764 family protein [Endozoicomonadaceae bacterium]|nr:DUF2764 family protein [Endozoicomonadaceae bacterium]MCY4330617.1 DUF2764 family protein [Endozoicomonadaceae bacterium]
MTSDYYTLLTSLPYMKSLFGSRRTPISRYQLNKRLSMLSEDDRKILTQIELLLFWEYPDNTEEQQLIRLANETVAAIQSDSLRDFVIYELNRRTLIMAVRLKLAGAPMPTKPCWSYGTYCGYMQNNWGSPSLGLHNTFPEISQITEAMSNNETLKVEKIILQSMWKHASKLSMRHHFDFESVVVYLVRWNLIHNFVSQNKAEAATRFNELVNKELKDFDTSLSFIKQ